MPQTSQLTPAWTGCGVESFVILLPGLALSGGDVGAWVGGLLACVNVQAGFELCALGWAVVICSKLHFKPVAAATGFAPAGWVACCGCCNCVPQEKLGDAGFVPAG